MNYDGERMESFEDKKVMINDARLHFDRLFSFLPKSFNELNQIKILVIGAGLFPSFASLVNSITYACPKANEINFILIEPKQSKTNIFKNRLSEVVDEFNVRSNVFIHNTDIKSYLEKTNEIFDLIYFEHPDVSLINVLVEKIRFSKNNLAQSMQESVPYLRKIIKDQSVIIGSFVFKGDLYEIKSLLKFSLGIKIHLVRKKLFFEGHYYCFGLIGIINESKLSNKIPEKLAKQIRFNTILFGLFLMTSIIIFLITPTKLKTTSFFFCMGQLFYIRYGITALIVRIVLIFGQISLIMTHQAVLFFFR